eukprot:gene1898-33310_t
MALNSSNIPQAPTSESANAISTVANIFKLTEAVCAVASCVALLQLISRNNRIITNTASSSTAPKAQHPSTSAITSTKVNAKRQQTVQASSAPAPALPFSYGTQQLGLLPMALLAGAILSGLVSRTLESFIRPPPVASGRGSAESALRIARLEAQNKQQAEALEKMASLVEKLQIRFRMLNANVKEPLAQAFTNLQVQTDVLTVHSDKHKQLSKRIEGIEELILALQAVSAKQFDHHVLLQEQLHVPLQLQVLLLELVLQV